MRASLPLLVVTTMATLSIPGCIEHRIRADPLHITLDVNLRVDRRLESFFDFQEELKQQVETGQTPPGAPQPTQPAEPTDPDEPLTPGEQTPAPPEPAPAEPAPTEPQPAQPTAPETPTETGREDTATDE